MAVDSITQQFESSVKVTAPSGVVSNQLMESWSAPNPLLQNETVVRNGFTDGVLLLAQLSESQVQLSPLEAAESIKTLAKTVQGEYPNEDDPNVNKLTSALSNVYLNAAQGISPYEAASKAGRDAQKSYIGDINKALSGSGLQLEVVNEELNTGRRSRLTNLVVNQNGVPRLSVQFDNTSGAVGF